MTTVEALTLLLGVITLIAIIYGPIAAVKVGKELQDRQHKLNRRDNVFTTLMSMRRIGLHLDHVKALNMIDVEFASNSPEDVAVKDAWKLYLNHLEDTDYSNDDPKGWGREKEKLFFDLLEVMAKALGYDVQRSQIERGSYIPQYYDDHEKRQQLLMNSIINLASGCNTLKVYDTEEDPTPDFVREQKTKTARQGPKTRKVREETKVKIIKP